MRWNFDAELGGERSGDVKTREQQKQNHLRPHFVLLMDNETSQRPLFFICKFKREREGTDVEH